MTSRRTFLTLALAPLVAPLVPAPVYDVTQAYGTPALAPVYHALETERILRLIATGTGLPYTQLIAEPPCLTR